MTEKPKKLKKGRVSEEDISTLLQRYSANTVLALLQEVAHFNGGVKIDWNALVKKSTTGISNAREYQMLWRHLAYRHSMLETFDDGAQPLDDDSDLEYELEAFPAVSGEASAEATACVKVMISSGLISDSSHTNNAMVEAPLTINIPNGQLGKATSESSNLSAMRGMNITVPVSVQKQSIPVMSSAEQTDTNGTVPPRRKRKNWTEAEDMELVSAVRKYGEGNWANILRSEFVWEGRTASQLSQRWANVRKKIGSYNVASNSSNNGAQISEEQRAAQIALNLALNPPVKNTFMSLGDGTSSQHHSQRSFAAKPSSKMQLGSAVKSQITVNKPVKPDLSSDPVRAAAVAAGARIATQSDAASLLRAAQAKNAIRIMPTVGSSIKSSLSHKEVTPVPTHLAVSPSGLRPPLEREFSQSIQRNPVSALDNTDPPLKPDIVNTGGLKSVPDVSKVQVQEHTASLERNELSMQVKQEKAILPNQERGIKTKETSGERLTVSPKLEVSLADGNCISVEKGENQRQVNGGNEDNLPRFVGDKLVHVNKKEPGSSSLLRGEDS